MLEKTYVQEIEGYTEGVLRNNLGLVLIKPDAIKLGVEEFIISEIASGVLPYARLDFVESLYINSKEQVRLIYPNEKPNIYDALDPYFIGNQSIVLSVKSFKPGFDLWEELKNLRGPNIWHWTDNMLNGRFERPRFIRRILPVVGGDLLWETIKNKSIRKEEMTPEEFMVYSQNLLHVATSLQDFKGILSILKPYEVELILRDLI